MQTSITLFFAIASLLGCAFANVVPFERLNKNDSLLLILDLQTGLYGLARDFDPMLYYNNMIAHAAIGQLFGIPVILSTSAQSGPNGNLPKEILDMYPDAPLIARQGEVDAWDNEEFRAAIKATGKSQVIVAGITTDVCTTFLALSLRAEGYSVWANVEASGTTTELIRDVSNDRMARAGVQLVSLFAIVCDKTIGLAQYSRSCDCDSMAAKVLSGLRRFGTTAWRCRRGWCNSAGRGCSPAMMRSRPAQSNGMQWIEKRMTEAGHVEVRGQRES